MKKINLFYAIVGSIFLVSSLAAVINKLEYDAGKTQIEFSLILMASSSVIILGITASINLICIAFKGKKLKVSVKL